MAVHTASRLLDLAGPNQVLISTTTRDLIDDPDLVVEDAGTHELKGLSGSRQVYRVVLAAA
jgi:class 3 adenylate cyclase